MSLFSFFIFVFIIELITCILRFAFGLQSRKVQKKLPFRMHHGYVGIILLVFNIFPEFSWALVASDAIHHFVVLPLTVKRTEFP